MKEKNSIIKVALVEDNAGIRKSLERLFAEKDDIEMTRMFGDGESALAELAALAPDVVLVDINLPGKSGIDVIREAKAALPQVQFLVLTVYDDPARIFQALAAGANGYLLKRATVVQAFHQMGTAPNETENLSPRENEILQLLADGYLYKEIAEKLSIGIETVRTYIRRIYDKLHVRTRTEAVVKHLTRR